MTTPRLHPSTVAASAAMQFSGDHKARILAALADGKDRTAAEIGEIVGLTVVQVDRRMIELKRDEKIAFVGNRFSNHKQIPGTSPARYMGAWKIKEVA